jgi:hypothetical protein
MKFGFFVSMLSAALMAQPHVPAPRSISAGLTPIDHLPQIAAPQIDAPTLRKQYHTSDPGRISEPAALSAPAQRSGLWELLPDGSRVWRLRVSAPGSLTTALVFENFHLPAHAEMYVYAVSGELVRKRPYTAANNPRDGVFATGPLPSDEAIIEVDVPAAEADDLKMTLTHVNRGFVKLGTLVGNIAKVATAQYTEPDTSGTCEVNLMCPQGQGKFKDAGMGVGMIVTAEGRLCSGFLITNTAQDYRQYFQTASHCGTPSGWSVVFDFESATCARGGASSLADQVTNVVEVARNDLSDFLLLEIEEPIPPDFNIFYNGFFTPNAIPLSGAAVIHHPLGNVKKISATFEPLSDSTFNGAIDFTDWRINTYDVGVTEAGSSGAPLLNTSTLVIGQVHGGFSSCSPYPGGPDYFGKFSLSFTSPNAAATQRTNTFLDPHGLIPDPSDPVKGSVAGSFPPGSLLSQVDTSVNALLQTSSLPTAASNLLQVASNQLNNSLTAQLWGRGPALLDGFWGSFVFVDAGAAAANLENLQTNYSSAFPVGAIQTQSANLVAAVRSIVTVALTQAPPNAVTKINGLLASGDASAAAGKSVDAIATYGLAWALEATNPIGSIAIIGGNSQAVPVGSAMMPLQILVKDIYGNPMPSGVPVTFANDFAESVVPQAESTFINNSDEITLATGDGGRISAPLTANGVPGVYGVKVFAGGVASQPEFSLTNIPAGPVSARVRVTQSPFTRDQTTGIWSATMTITNVGETALAAPVQVLLTGMSSGVTLSNGSGTLGGISYVTVTAGTLNPGASASVSIQFSNPLGQSITYQPFTYAGQNLGGQ